MESERLDKVPENTRSACVLLGVLENTSPDLAFWRSRFGVLPLAFCPGVLGGGWRSGFGVLGLWRSGPGVLGCLAFCLAFCPGVLGAGVLGGVLENMAFCLAFWRSAWRSGAPQAIGAFCIPLREWCDFRCAVFWIFLNSHARRPGRPATLLAFWRPGLPAALAFWRSGFGVLGWLAFCLAFCPSVLGAGVLAGVLAFWRSGVLAFWRSGVLAFWRSGVLAFCLAFSRTPSVLAFWRSGVLAF